MAQAFFIALILTLKLTTLSSSSFKPYHYINKGIILRSNHK